MPGDAGTRLKRDAGPYCACWMGSVKQGANAGGRPKAIISLVELARAQTEDSIKTLVQVRDDTNAPAAARVGAANALLDRGWGKPAQTVTQIINDKRSTLDWTTDELVAFLRERQSPGDRAPKKKANDREPDSVH
jgi:hypothetical protein